MRLLREFVAEDGLVICLQRVCPERAGI